jgi:hypothetical protein
MEDGRHPDGGKVIAVTTSRDADIAAIKSQADKIRALAEELLLEPHLNANSVAGSFVGQGVEMLLNNGVPASTIVELVRQTIGHLQQQTPLEQVYDQEVRKRS